MWVKKVKANKRQYLLFALIVFITVSVFSMCFSFVVELGEYTKGVLNSNNSSDVYIMTMNDKPLKDNITDDDVYNNIEDQIKYKGYYLTAPIKYDDRNISMLFQSALEMKNNTIKDMKQFSLVESKNNQKAPSKGEVWLPMILSDPLGIKIGDEITLDYDDPIKLKVSGIYKAKVLISQNLGFAPIILSDDDLETISKIEQPITLYGLKLNNSSEQSISDLKDDCPALSFSVTREQLMSNFQQVANVMGNIGAIAAIIIFAAALAIIRFVIKNNIIREYNSIGIYKSLGYTDRQISFFYINGYMVVGAISAIVGSFALLPVVQKLGEVCTKFADPFHITGFSLQTISTTMGLFMLLIFINVKRGLSIIRKKTAVDILRDYKTMGVKKVRKSLIKNAFSPLSTAINTMHKHIGATILSVFVFMFAVHLALIFLMIGYSSYKMDDNYNKWFAIPKNEGYVSGILDDEVIDYIDNSDQIDSFVYGSLCTSVSVKTDTVNKSLSLFNFDVFSNANPAITKVEINGNYPHTNSEVALTRKALQYLGLKVGDEIDLEINGNTKTYTIVGDYASMFSNLGIMMTVDAMEDINADYKPTCAFINLARDVSLDDFEADVEEKFTSISVDKDIFMIDIAMAATKTMLVDISAIMTIVFLIFTMISLSMVVSINIENKMRENGIMAALGFTPNYIIAQSVWSTFITAIIGMALAMLLHFSMSGKILSIFMVDAFENSYLLIIGYLVVELLITVIMTIILNWKVSRVSPKILIED